MAAKGTKRGFWIILSSGDKFEVSELDFNHLKGRVSRGQTNGWYMQRGPAMGDRHEWQIQFKYLAGFWADQEAIVAEDTPVKPVDIEKRLPPKVGKKEEPSPKCNHDWNNIGTYEFVAQNVNGVNRYYKRCTKCETKSTLIKTREVELAMQANGKTLDDVTMID